MFPMVSDPLIHLPTIKEMKVFKTCIDIIWYILLIKSLLCLAVILGIRV